MKDICPASEIRGCQKNSTKSSGSSDTTSRKNLGKIQRLFGIFILGKSLHRFEAQQYGCSCLNSTVSDIRNSYGIRLSRKSVHIPNRWSKKPTKVTKYWLALNQRPYATGKLARALVVQGKANNISDAIRRIQALLDE